MREVYRAEMYGPEYPDQQTIRRPAERLADQSGRSISQEWEHALRILDAVYDHDVLALDENGRVVNLRRVEQLYAGESADGLPR